tara:strand:- start:46 stop:828 length:783 start_codon:yes stop_codon:yes gene_type:complete
MKTLTLPNNLSSFAATGGQKALQAAVGGMTETSKMPGFSFSIPARITCPVGNKLADIPGTPCFECYADGRGAYGWRPVIAAQHRRLDILRVAIADPAKGREWVASFAELLNSKADRAEKKAARLSSKAAGRAYLRDRLYFRWHDSGDVMNLAHLVLIALVAKATPRLSHWLPTQERATLKAYRKAYGALPENLTVRVSSPRVDAPVSGIASMVLTDPSNPPAGAFTCPAYRDRPGAEKGSCGTCRACWIPAVALVAYPVH